MLTTTTTTNKEMNKKKDREGQKKINIDEMILKWMWSKQTGH